MSQSDLNVVVVRGTVRGAPDVRVLPSGSTAVTFDVTTRDPEPSDVPVVRYDQPVEVGPGDLVVVTGRVRRRFFRSGGATFSRTELVADRVIPARRRRQVERAIADAVSRLG